jgi:hypothetical protein
MHGTKNTKTMYVPTKSIQTHVFVLKQIKYGEIAELRCSVREKQAKKCDFMLVGRREK